MVEVVTSDTLTELGAADGAKERRDIALSLKLHMHLNYMIIGTCAGASSASL